MLSLRCLDCDLHSLAIAAARSCDCTGLGAAGVCGGGCAPDDAGEARGSCRRRQPEDGQREAASREEEEKREESKLQRARSTRGGEESAAGLAEEAWCLSAGGPVAWCATSNSSSVPFPEPTARLPDHDTAEERSEKRGGELRHACSATYSPAECLSPW
jgi:hypothetical protein